MTISLGNESTSQTFTGVSSVTISTPGGGNSINVDPSVTAPVSVYGGAGSNVTGQVANWPDVSLEADLPTVAESGGQTGEFTFSADDTANGPVTAYFQIGSSSTAWLDYNYTISGATALGCDTYAVTIPANTGEAKVEITPIDTGAVGGSETVVLDLIAGDGYNVDTASSTATVTIFNNDLPTVSIVADEPVAAGSSAPGDFTVSLSAPVSEPLLVNYTIGGTATNGYDYQTIPGNVYIPAGNTTATIPIDPLDVGATSGNTSVFLTLAAGSGYVIPSPAPSDTVTIYDSPAASEFYIGTGGTFAVPPGATTLYLGFHDNYDWTDNPGSVAANLTWNGGGEGVPPLTVTGDACLEFAFAPSGAAGPWPGENVDDDRPIEVSVPDGATSVAIAASGAWDYETLPGGDIRYGPDGNPSYSGPTWPEYYAANLNSENISPVSCNFSSLVGMWCPVSSPPTPTLAVHDTVAVAGDSETFTVTLSQQVGYSVSVPYQTEDGSAVAGTDYTATSGTLTFPAGQIIQTFTVPTQLDFNATGDLYFSVVLGAPSVGTVNGGGSTGTATIEQVTGTLTIYNADGTPSVDGAVGVGESAPMIVRLTSPATVDGKFTLSYDTDYFKVTTDAAGNDVVTPGVTPIAPSTGGAQLYLWGIAPTSDPSGSQISLDYGDPILCTVANAQVAATEQDAYEIAHNINPDAALTAQQNGWLATATTALSKLGLSAAQQGVRIEVLEAVLRGKVTLPTAGTDGTRSGTYWTLSRDGYVVAAVQTAERAIDELWDPQPQGSQQIFCLKYSSLIMAEGLFRYFQEQGNQAGTNALNKLIGNNIIPEGLPANSLWTSKSTANPAGFQAADLTPGDQIYFKNPYYTQGCALVYAWAYKKYLAQGDSAQEAAKLATADATEAKNAEQGSNVFYLGTDANGVGWVVRIYGDHSMKYTIAQYQEDFLMKDYSVQALMADMKANPQKYIGKPAITASTFTITRVRSVIDPSTIK